MEKEKIRFSGAYQLIKEINIALPQHRLYLNHNKRKEVSTMPRT